MYKDKLEIWLESPYIIDKIKEELKAVEKIESEIEDRFYKDLEFGTGGMRGKIGAGTNRMNIHTVSKATQGISNFLKKKYSGEISVAIAYDSRHKSEEFAKNTACVFAANNINVYLFESLRPTPELSYAVRFLKCKCGVVITASHNPPEYNGYKVYDEYGGQIVKDADEIISNIKEVKLQDIKYSKFDGNNYIKIIGHEIDNSYINNIKQLSLSLNTDKDIKIVYTPLHGTGNKLVRRVIEEMGYKKIYVVKEQEKPDPNFSTVKSPNPEELSSFELAINTAKKINADIIIGTDPDCDRVGLIVKNHNDEYEPLNGNQTGALLLNYILSSLKVKNKIPSNGAVIKTVVTSEIARDIASKYGLSTFDTLTGFKYIGELIQTFADNNNYTYVFGYEESFGYLAGTFVRDKDAVIASMLICEMAAYYRTKNKILLDILNDLYEEYGYYIEETLSLNFTGVAGQNKMKAIMEFFRENKPNSLAGKKIPYVHDYKMSIASNLVNGKIEKLNFPKSDVLKFYFENGSWLVLRPSGTEPKLKVYFSIKEDSKEKAHETLRNAKEEILNIIDRIRI